jgi:hypothetical protein
MATRLPLQTLILDFVSARRLKKKKKSYLTPQTPKVKWERRDYVGQYGNTSTYAVTEERNTKKSFCFCLQNYC